MWLKMTWWVGDFGKHGRLLRRGDILHWDITAKELALQRAGKAFFAEERTSGKVLS